MSDVRRWTPDPGHRTILVLITLFAVGMCVYLARDTETMRGLVLAALPILLVPVGAFLLVVRPVVELQGDVLLVRNPLGSTSMPVSSIESMAPTGRYGVDILLDSGRTVKPWVFQGASTDSLARMDEFIRTVSERAGRELQPEEG